MGAMTDSNVLIEQMAADISSQALRLDDVRLRLFMQWLNAHSSKVKAATEPESRSLQPGRGEVTFPRETIMEEQLKAGLGKWFESLPLQGILWEYRLILDEIAWWRDLEAHRLAMILGSEIVN